MVVDVPSADQEVFLCRLRVQGESYDYTKMDDETGKLPSLSFFPLFCVAVLNKRNHTYPSVIQARGSVLTKSYQYLSLSWNVLVKNSSISCTFFCSTYKSL